MRRITPVLVIAFGIGVAAIPAHAADLLGLYVGGAGGQATLRVDDASLSGKVGAPSSQPFSFSKHVAGWKVQLGFRPVSFVGGEVEYIDFGQGTTSFDRVNSVTALYYSINTDAKAASVLGVLYLPLPVPGVDIYGKAGVARLETKSSGGGTYGCLFDCSSYSGTFYRDDTQNRFAYGAGAQVKIGTFAIRVEYERIDASTGGPDLLSLGAIWIF
jgi:opacity protein-like surface antigen